MQFDDLLEAIGPLGRYQAFTFTLIGSALLCVAANHMANVFLAALPDYHCKTGKV